MEPKDRIKTLVSSKLSAMKGKVSGKEEQAGRKVRASEDDVRAALTDWPATPKRVAEDLINRYGAPNEATFSHLVWYDNGPWKRTVVSRDEIPHNFPTPHTDFITQYIDYRVPPERASDAVAFDGSVLIDRTAGEVAARCDMEAMNLLTLNLLHEIVTGQRTVEEARKMYAEQASAYMLDRPAPYTERLLFQPRAGETADLDESMIAPAMLHQAVQKGRDMLQRR